jgi:hypothetical protein
MKAERRLSSWLVAAVVGTVVAVVAYTLLLVLNAEGGSDEHPARWLDSWPWLVMTALFGAFVSLLASAAWERIRA